jgi:2-C-methyl-D-erythritol 4-phosphate cytidylyltransferase/2-C-methyl-D-erythritol 2,4-cyclodiphosphate synthase
LAAAGNSTRMKTKTKKPLLILNEKPIITYSLKVFNECEHINEIIIVARKDDQEKIKKIIKNYKIEKVKALAIGGKTRQESVYNGVRLTNKNSTHILVHDAARPLISCRIVLDLIKAAKTHTAISISSPIDDTVKELDSQQFVRKTLNRDTIVKVETPQLFKKDLYLKAFLKAKNEKKIFTDDCQLIENIGHKVFIVKSYKPNLKLTRRKDLEILEAILPKKTTKMRIGQGYDLHKLVKSDSPLMLGGIVIPYEKALIGYSDADVLTHAIIDAILGAAGLGDIGEIFPTTNKKFKNADSMNLLKLVIKKVSNKNFKIQNIDCTIIAEKPNLSKYKKKIEKNISRVCQIPEDCVNVKAKTNENLGYIGKEKAIKAIASCFLC